MVSEPASAPSPLPVVTGLASNVICSMCGITVGGPPPMTWMLETDARRGSVWVCDSCAREHLRAIESKLDQAWW